MMSFVYLLRLVYIPLVPPRCPGVSVNCFGTIYQIQSAVTIYKIYKLSRAIGGELYFVGKGDSI